MAQSRSRFEYIAGRCLTAITHSKGIRTLAGRTIELPARCIDRLVDLAEEGGYVVIGPLGYNMS